MRQLHVVTDASITSGGEGLAALRYAQAIACESIRVTLLARRISEESNNKFSKNTFEQLAPSPRGNLLINLVAIYDFIHDLCEAKKYNLIHLHGMWSPFLAVAALVARRCDIPILISPHGCIEPWALKNKYYKKLIAMKIYQGAILRSACLFVAASDQESRSLRNLGFKQHIAIIPNGVDAEIVTPMRAHTNFKTILFLSRVHPKKGLLDLVEAWALVRQHGWRIVIAGGDEEGYRAKVEELIQRKGLASDFLFTGFVQGASKQACFDQATIFILPTYSENFGIAVAEALVNELPVITTTGSPWSDLIEYGCGWWVEPGIRGISNALVEAMDCESDELRQMGRRGRALVLSKYSWEKTGVIAQKVSEWVLDNSRPKPEAVDILEL